MARALRSSKKQPAFDPSELKDLIFSPAVGTGVGSHLLGPVRDFPASANKKTNQLSDLTAAVTSDPATIDRSPTDTVVMSTAQRSDGLRSAASILRDLQSLSELQSKQLDLSTVDLTQPPTVAETPTVSGDQQSSAQHEVMMDMTTVVLTNSTTVLTSTVVGASQSDSELESALAESESAEQGGEAYGQYLGIRVADDNPGTVDIPDVATVELPQIQFATPPKNVLLWITEQGDLVPQGRVKRIRLAQDVINSAEESVYDTLWTAKSAQTDDRDSSRVVQAGYDYLVKRTRLSKKTIQRIVAKLIDKDFIAIERRADIYQRTSTIYRVFSYKAVLDRHLQKGRSHVAKIGPGFSYVRPMSDPRLSMQTYSVSVPVPANLSTVDTSRRFAVVTKDVPTAVNPTTVTVALSDPSTVVRRTTAFIGNQILDKTTASSAIYQTLSQYGAVDDDIVDRLMANCKQQAPDCTQEEIIHFIHEKGSLIRVRDSRIYSPIGFLLTAVPKCLSGEAFRLYREEQMKQREAEATYEAKRQAELDEWRREQEARLADPKVSEEDKQFIRKCLGIQ